MTSKNKKGRREFVRKVSLTSFVLIPGSNVLAGLLSDPATGKTDSNNFIDESLRLIDHRNLLNLEFYFINAVKETKDGRTHIKKKNNDLQYRESYMIVRLPQQHIAEENIASDQLPRVNKLFFAVSYISGYSYLVFKLFHNNEKETIPADAAALMNWNNTTRFKLVIRQNIKDSIFRLQQTGSAILENEYPLGYRIQGASQKFDKDNFPKVESRFAVDRISDPSPITAIEAPYKLILSPELPDQFKYRFRWSFSNYIPTTNKSCDSYELWTATLKAERIDKKIIKEIKDDPSFSAPSELPKEQDNEGDNYLRLALIGSPDYKDRIEAQRAGAEVKPVTTEECKKIELVLPDSRDRNDLVELYIKYKLRARTPSLQFSPLGLSSNIELKNIYFQKTLVAGNSLYEWKQVMSYGRDQSVEVSRVVIEACFGLKMLHIKKTRRETYKGGSILVYREYLMPLEIEKDYTLFNNENTANYNNDNWKCNSPFKKVEFAETGPKQILPIRSMAADQNLKEYLVASQDPAGNDCYNDLQAFWPCTTAGDFIDWSFRVTDWHGNEHVCKKKIFIYTSTLVDLTKPAIPELPPNFETSIEQEIFKPVEPKTAFAELENEVSRKLTNMKNQAHGTWVKIMDLGEHFNLKRIDHYTDHLEKLLQHTENKIRSAAKNIEDQAIEEWIVFKRKILEQEKKLLRSIDSILEFVAEARQLRGIIPAPATPTLADIENKIIGYKNQLLALIERSATDLLSRARAIIVNLLPVINTELLVLVEQTRVKDITDKIKNAGNDLRLLHDKLSIGFEQEYREFLERIPGRLRNILKNQIGNDIDNIRLCVNRIRTLENNIKSKIQFNKARIGYAVYHVDEELEKVKTKLKEKFGGKWEEEYNKFKNEYHKAINGTISAFETDYLILKGNVRHAVLKTADDVEKKVFDFFDEYACFPQLHSATVYVQSINELVNKEIPCKIKYAKDYIENQVHDVILDTKNNASRVFAEIKADAKEYVKSAVREINKELGGIVNPDMAADFLTYLKDTRDLAENTATAVFKKAEGELRSKADAIIKAGKEEIEEELKKQFLDNPAYAEIKKEMMESLLTTKRSLQMIGKEAKEHFEQYRDWAKMEGKEFFKGLEAKILGGIHLKDILGVGFELPKLDRTNNKLTYRFITNKLQPVQVGPFSFDNKSGAASLVIYLEKPLSNPSSYTAWTSLNDFRVGIFQNRVIVDFDKLQVYSDQNTKNKITVKIRDVKFTQELAFLDALSKNIKIPGTGLSLNIYPTQISIDFAYTVPGISGGAFSFDNLKFGVGVYIPLPIGSTQGQMPVTAKFAINGPDDKFVVAAGIWGGKGHFVLEATPKYIRRIDAGIDFGGYLALNLGIAKGEAFLMAGIRYVYFRDEMGEVGFELYCTLSCGGSVTVFGFITISVVFLLCLKYQKFQGRTTLYGTASVTYSIKIGFFRKSFSLTFSRRLHGSEAGSQNANQGYRLQREKSIQYAVYRANGIEDRSAYRFAGNNDDYDRQDAQPVLSDSFSALQWYQMVNTFKLN